MGTHFPHDLVRIQRDWHDTYRAMATGSGATASYRRRLLLLSVRLWWHPFWDTPAGRTPAARVELHRLALPEAPQGAWS